MGFFRKELLYVLILVCGSTFVGQSLAYYSPAGPKIVPDLGWKKSTGTWFSTLSSLTAILGGPITNVIVPKLGRKLPCFIFSCIALVTWILIGVTRKSFSWLAFVARFIQGICVGGLSSICSMYIVEISPPENRGSYGTLHQLGVTIGMAYCYLIGIWCGWRAVTFLCTLFTALLCILIWFVPESPVVLALKHAEVANIEKEKLFQKKFVPPMIAAFFLMFFQQFSGINALDTNLETIFENAHVDLKPSICALLVGLSQCISTAGVSFIVEKFGRRIPMIISGFGQGVALLLTWAAGVWKLSATVPIIAIFLDFFFFGVGFGPVPWFICPELFEDSVRQLAVSLSTGLNWLFVSIIIFVWPEMQKGIGDAWGFFIFAIICVLGGVYGIFWMPETGVAAQQAASNIENNEEEDNKEKVPQPEISEL